MTELSMTPDAIRMRRMRELRRTGVVYLTTLEVTRKQTEALIWRGYLPKHKAYEYEATQAAVTAALNDLLSGTWQRVKPKPPDPEDN